MNIETEHKEIIPLNDFELGWRWKKTHNPDISESEKNQILPVSELESKRLYKIIKYFEIEGNLTEKYTQTDWISASQESKDKTERFQKQIESILKPWDEDILINWHRNITLKTTKKIFIKYWTDFLYPSSDDVTIISEKTNWIIFYRHFEVANIWTKITDRNEGNNQK
ncbi:hypothetical protein [Cellulophaga sp. Z1A5H]|uniref:hypothetical protein n=1 Tax=Cellulophaga sp. Z1A5H TaxID=2687291 RepID=UPI0013FD625A|nr:hypothetical protein [Cellulophaga sp. Z1A5H]